jgi:hypothetical protein
MISICYVSINRWADLGPGDLVAMVAVVLVPWVKDVHCQTDWDLD